MIRRLCKRFGTTLVLGVLILFSAAAYAAGTKISDLVSGEPLQATDAFPIQRSSSNYKGTIANINTYVQANQDAELQAIAGLTSAADRLAYYTGSGTASLATFTSYGRSLVDDADAAAAHQTLEMVRTIYPLASRYYLAGPPAASSTNTNSNLLVTDTMYGIIVPLPKGTIQSLHTRTGTSSSSVGAKIRMCLYSVNSDLSPNALLASSEEVNITDASGAATFDATIASPVAIEAGVYLIAVWGTATTTQMIPAVYSTGSPWATWLGAATNTALTNTVTTGYTSTVTYTTACPASFGTTTAITSSNASTTNQMPVVGYRLQ